MDHYQQEQPAYVKTDSSNTITCMICQAMYTPLPEYGYMTDAAAIVLESAFMSMCHFCFRCRRPACPQCWDEVHGVCGMCVLEAQLQFRVAATPLAGVEYPLPQKKRLQQTYVVEKRLECIFPGHFHELAADKQTTLPIPTLERPRPVYHATQLTPSIRSRESTAQLQSAIRPDENRDRTTERTGQSASVKIPTRPVRESSKARQEKAAVKGEPHDASNGGWPDRSVVAEIPTRPDHKRNSVRQSLIQTEQTGMHTSDKDRKHTLAKVSTRPEQDLEKIPVWRQRLPPAREHTRTRVERISTLIAGTLLICIIVIIALSAASSDINTLFVHLLHIDIQAEIAYLWRLLQQLHA